MLIIGNSNASQLRLCLKAASRFLLSADEPAVIIKHQVATIRAHWDQVCDDAQLNAGERDILSNGAFFKHYAFEGLPAEGAKA